MDVYFVAHQDEWFFLFREPMAAVYVMLRLY